MFLDVCLPSMLTPGNLPSLAHSFELTFLILTTPGNRRDTDGHPGIGALKRIADVEIEEEGNLTAERKFDIHHRHWQQAIARAKLEGSYLCLLPPDICFSDGSLSAIGKRISAGAACIYISGVRVTSETFVPDVVEAYFRDPGAPTALPHGELVRLTLKHSHPFNNCLYLDAPDSAHIAEMVLVPVPGVGLVKHCFVAGPIVFVDPLRAGFNPIQVITSVERRSDYHVVYDSHEVGMVSLSPLHLYGDWYLACGKEDAIVKSFKYDKAYRSLSSEVVSGDNFRIYGEQDQLRGAAWQTACARMGKASAEVKSRYKLIALGRAMSNSGLTRAGGLAILAAVSGNSTISLDREARYFCAMPNDALLNETVVRNLFHSGGMIGLMELLKRHILCPPPTASDHAVSLTGETFRLTGENGGFRFGDVLGALVGATSDAAIYRLDGYLPATTEEEPADRFDAAEQRA